MDPLHGRRLLEGYPGCLQPGEQAGRDWRHIEKPGLDVQPADIGIELGEALAQAAAVEGVGAQTKTVQHPMALLRVGLREIRRHAHSGDIEAAAFDQKGLPRFRLEVEPELSRLECQPGVKRIQVVIADRSGQTEGRCS